MIVLETGEEGISGIQAGEAGTLAWLIIESDNHGQSSGFLASYAKLLDIYQVTRIFTIMISLLVSREFDSHCNGISHSQVAHA